MNGDPPIRAATTADTPATRLAPQVVRVPPPEKLPRAPLIAGIGFMIVALAFSVIVPYPFGLAMGGSFAIVALAFLGGTWFGARSARRQRAKMLADFCNLLADPVVGRLDDLCIQSAFNPLKPKSVQKALAASDLPPCPTARIVCFGPMQIPEVGELRFEPYVVSATAFLARRLLLVPIALVFVTFWLLQSTHVIPGARVNLSGFTYFFVIAAVTVVTWVWRGAIRPTYVRMAPGIIQVLEYGLRRGKPVIRTYPIEAGTLVLVSGGKKGLTATLLRDGQKDTLPIAQLRNRAEATERLWQALLSTAPIPQMSDEELIE